MDKESRFYWERFPDAENLFLQIIEKGRKENADIAYLDEKLAALTSTRMFDWVDHVVIDDGDPVGKRFDGLGFSKQLHGNIQVCIHAGTRLPGIVLTVPDAELLPGVALRVESIADFQQANGFQGAIQGTPLSPYRRCRISRGKGMALYAVERRGTPGFIPSSMRGDAIQDYMEAVEYWKHLPRNSKDEEGALNKILNAAEDLGSRLGQDMAAHVVCMCERDYWYTRNTAARVQKMSQDRLGMGWANHDHHTFRSSRHHFTKLVELFTCLGFHKRERFYAGQEAGWGAQVMENPNAGLVLFLDVDLAPQEVDVDFASSGLKEQDELGTVGLWCALHGDSILQAGMHHLAGNFLFQHLINDLSSQGVEFMSPFSDFSYLKQAFSKGEKWEVNPEKVRKLLDSNLIENEEAENFLRQGAVGSHLENIQRKEGYKGFNQKNVSTIIKETDPRRQSTQ